MCPSERPASAWAAPWRALRAWIAGPPATFPTLAPLHVTPAAPAPVPAPLALVNGRLIDGTGATPVADAVVLIQDGRIQTVGSGERGTIPAGCQTIDVRGATILPGLINAHVHYAYDIARLKRWAEAGVTTVRELGILTPAESLEQRYILRDNTWIDPQLARIVAASPCIAIPKGYGSLYAGSAEEARRVALQALDQGAEQIKFAFEDYRFPLTRWPLLPLEMGRTLVQAAHARGVRALVHITQAKYAPLALDTGADEIVHMPYDKLPDAVIQRAFDLFIADQGRVWSPEELIARTRDELQPHFAPNAQQAYYSDTNYMLLGKIIEAASGKPLQDAYADLLFQPLGLTHTWLSARSEPQERPAAAPAEVFTKDTNITRVRAGGSYWADGGLVATAEDMARGS